MGDFFTMEHRKDMKKRKIHDLRSLGLIYNPGFFTSPLFQTVCLYS